MEEQLSDLGHSRTKKATRIVHPDDEGFEAMDIKTQTYHLPEIDKELSNIIFTISDSEVSPLHRVKIFLALFDGKLIDQIKLRIL